MKLDRLQVDNCRNVSGLYLEPSESLNLIVGANGAGKTTLLEAVHFLVRGKSFRHGSVDSVIQHGAESMNLAARWSQGSLSVVVRCVKDRSTPIRLLRDGRPLTAISQAAQMNPVMALSPNLTELVFGPPVNRRQWIDWGVFHVKPRYADEHRRFRHTLSQHNAALRSRDQATIRLWGDRLVEAAEPIIGARETYVGNLRPYLEKWLGHMCPEIGVDVDFFKGFRGSHLTEELDKQRLRDVELGNTRFGPHRADLTLRVRRDSGAGREATRSPVSTELSRGQGKALASALYLAQADHLKEHRAVPLFLIDDIESEFDGVHFPRLVSALRQLDAQVLATAIDEQRARSRGVARGFNEMTVAEMTGGALRVIASN